MVMATAAALIAMAIYIVGNPTTPAQPNDDVLNDWLARANGQGVSWYQDFETQQEVDQFRWSAGVQNDPGDLSSDRAETVRWRDDDGITPGHGCLEIYRPAGSQDPSNWWRQLSALVAGSNGRASDDPAVGGTLTRRTFTPTQGGTQTSSWDLGWYGHPDYHAANPGKFDGHEYYFQCRVKIDPERIVGTNDDGGKLFYFTVTDSSNVRQEIVTVSGRQRGTPERNVFDMYRSGDGSGLDQSPDNDVSVTGNQPGSNFTAGVGNGVCRFDNNGGRLANCWSWPMGKWVTILYRVKAGKGNVVNGDVETNTEVEVWKAEEGETQYTRIFLNPNVQLPFQFLQGHNAVICSGYMNGQTFSHGFYQRYCQMIFSQQFIACPQAYKAKTVLRQVAEGLTVGQSVVPANIAIVDNGAPFAGFHWQSRFHWDPKREKAFIIGRHQGWSTPAHHIAVYSARPNTFSRGSPTGFVNTGRGHTWEMPSYDRKGGRMFCIENGGAHDRAMHCNVDTQNPLDGGSAWNLTAYPGTLETGQSWASPNNILSGGGPEIVSGSTGTAYHPNLFGRNLPGLIIVTQRGVMAYRFDTRLYVVLINNPTFLGASAGNTNNRVGILYSEGLDAAFFYSNFGTARWRIGRGPTITQISAPPVPFHHDVDTTNCAAMIDDPFGRPWWYAYEKFGTRLWKYDATTDTHGVVSTAHPFAGRGQDPGNYILCAVYGEGIVAAWEEVQTDRWRINVHMPQV
jgi:hypothetical protein